MSLWHWILSILFAVVADEEAARCFAAVSASYASIAPADVPPSPPGPSPDSDKCCPECNGTGWVTRDGVIRTPCDCPPSCKCKQGEMWK